VKSKSKKTDHCVCKEKQFLKTSATSDRYRGHFDGKLQQIDFNKILCNAVHDLRYKAVLLNPWVATQKWVAVWFWWIAVILLFIFAGFIVLLILSNLLHNYISDAICLVVTNRYCDFFFDITMLARIILDQHCSSIKLAVVCTGFDLQKNFHLKFEKWFGKIYCRR